MGDAKFEKLVRRESRQSLYNNTDHHDKNIPEVTEEEAELLESLEDEAANSKIKLSFLLKLTNSVLGVGSLLKCLEVEDGNLIHLETREPRSVQEEDSKVVVLEVLLTVEIVKDRILQLAGRLKQESHGAGLLVPASHLSARHLQPHPHQVRARAGHDAPGLE